MKETVLYFEKDKSDANLRKELLAVGIHALETDEIIDPHYMQHVENNKVGETSIRFSSVDAEIENLLGTENADESDMRVKELFEKVLIGEKKEENKEANPFGEGGKEIQVAKVKNSKTPAYFKVDEQMKRFAKMTESMGQNAMFPVKKTLVINPANPLIKNALKIHEKGTHAPLVEKICHYVEDLALISSEGLKTEDKENFVVRTQELVGELTDIAFN
jgi:molecular chaperone HtpG